MPCRLCLEWETYADGIAYGSAEFDTSSWTGTVGGGSFVAYWERNYETNECEFVVTFDDDEVYRATCYEGASCRNPAGEVSASIGYEEGTLRWSVYEPRELALIDDPETGCRDFFCGTCRCTCDCLCVTITEPDGNIIQGELCTASYPCDAPVWEGTLGYYDLSIALGRDEHTAECIISLTANGEEPEPVFVTGCADMSASVTLYDGTIISVACKLCSCEETPPIIGNCICGRPMGPTLKVIWSSGNGTHGDAPREFVINYGMIDEPTIPCSPWSPGPFPGYRGTVSGNFPIPQGGSQPDSLDVILVCECIGCTYCVYYRWLNSFYDQSNPLEWHLGAYVILSCDCPAILDLLEGFSRGGHPYNISDVTIYELESNCT